MPAMPASAAVPPAVELPSNQVVDKDTLAKSVFGKDFEVRSTPVRAGAAA